MRHSNYTRCTKLSTTRFSPALSNAMVSLLPSTAITSPLPNFMSNTREPALSKSPNLPEKFNGKVLAPNEQNNYYHSSYSSNFQPAMEGRLAAGDTRHKSGRGDCKGHSE